MKYFLTFAIAFCLGVWWCHSDHPVAYKPAAVTVSKGDTMESIICNLKEEYHDTRDWRAIAYSAYEDNDIGKYIYPGQVLVFKMEVHK